MYSEVSWEFVHLVCFFCRVEGERLILKDRRALHPHRARPWTAQTYQDALLRGKKDRPFSLSTWRYVYLEKEDKNMKNICIFWAMAVQNFVMLVLKVSNYGHFWKWCGIRMSPLTELLQIRISIAIESFQVLYCKLTFCHCICFIEFENALF